MLKANLNWRMWFLGGFLPMFLGSLHAEDIQHGPGPGDLNLRIEAGKHVFSLYEPVNVTYTLANPTDSTITSKARMDVYGVGMELFIQHEDSNRVQWKGPVIADFIGNPDTVLSPKQAITSSVLIFYNYLARDLAFPRPGHYELSGRMFLGSFPEPTYAEATVVSIEVVDPSPEDRQVLKYLGSEANLIHLLREGGSAYCKGESEAKCIEELRQVSSRFPNSSYSPSIAYYLGSSIGWDGPGHPAQYDLESQILLDFLNRWPSHPLGPNVTGLLAYALHKAGKQEEAMAWVGRFEEKYPDRKSPRQGIEGSNRKK